MPFTRFNPRQKAISQKVIIYLNTLKHIQLNLHNPTKSTLKNENCYAWFGLYCPFLCRLTGGAT